MGKISLVPDNSVLGNLGNFLMNPAGFPVQLRDDVDAFRKLIVLARKDTIEIGIPTTTTMKEHFKAGGKKRALVRKEMKSAFGTWPGLDLLETTRQGINQRSECLWRIAQDKDGTDSRNFIVSTAYRPIPYYLMMDQKYINAVRPQAYRIKQLCGININILLTPSEFLKKYKKGEMYNSGDIT